MYFMYLIIETIDSESKLNCYDLCANDQFSVCASYGIHGHNVCSKVIFFTVSTLSPYLCRQC